MSANLKLTEYNTQKSWLLTGWKTNEPDEISEVSTQSDPTQLKPMFSRQELGAGLVSILSQNPENASENQEKMRFSIAPIHSGFETFNKASLNNKDIKWHVNFESSTPLDSGRTTESVTSRGKLL